MDPKIMVDRILKGESPRAVLEGSVEEAATVTKKVVRNGKIVKKQFKKNKVHKVLSAAQKKALKAAQKASKTATAKNKRKKSLNKRKSFEGVGEEFNVLCPACGSENLDVQQDTETGAVTFVCPDCGKTFYLLDTEIIDAFAEGIDDEDDDEGEEYEGDGEEYEGEEGEYFEDGEEAGVEEGCGGSDDDDPQYFED